MAQGSDSKGDSSATSTVDAARIAPRIEEKETPAIRAPAPGNGRPREAIVAIYLMIVAGAIAIALALYWISWGNSPLGGILFLLLGVAYAYGGRALHRGESWGWGAGVFAGVFAVLFGVFLLPLAAVLIVLAIVAIAFLFRVRDYFGMVRPDPKEEERVSRDLEARRTSNPEGVHCPHCGSTALWIAPDGSAFCQNCKAGVISLKVLAEGEPS